MKNVKRKCCICQREFEGYGNNAEPVSPGVCCDDCNMSVVVPARCQAWRESGELFRQVAEEFG